MGYLKPETYLRRYLKEAIHRKGKGGIGGRTWRCISKIGDALASRAILPEELVSKGYSIKITAHGDRVLVLPISPEDLRPIYAHIKIGVPAFPLPLELGNFVFWERGHIGRSPVAYWKFIEDIRDCGLLDARSDDRRSNKKVQ
jgi:hypothetical protein